MEKKDIDTSNSRQRLEALEANYKRYHSLLEEYFKNDQGGFSELEKYAISVHKQNGFKIESEDSVMFYNRIAVLNNLNEKLTAEYPKFQHWAIFWFLDCIVMLAIKNGIHSFLDEDISSLNEPNDLIQALKSLHVKRLRELFYKCKDPNYSSNDEVFKCICQVVGIFMGDQKNDGRNERSLRAS